MKKIVFVFAIVALLSSCEKDNCWTLVDCIGNDIGNICLSEKEVQDYCAANSTPGCKITYRK